MESLEGHSDVEVEVEPPAKRIKFENGPETEANGMTVISPILNLPVSQKDDSLVNDDDEESPVVPEHESHPEESSIIENSLSESIDGSNEPSSTDNGADASASEDESDSSECPKVSTKLEECVEKPIQAVLSATGHISSKKNTAKRVSSNEKKMSKSSKVEVPVQGSSKRKSANLRRNIKDILKTDSLGEETLAAQREEAERRQRIQLQQQQLKILQLHQQHQQLMKESGIDPSSGARTSLNGLSPAPLTLEAIVNQIAQNRHTSVSLGSDVEGKEVSIEQPPLASERLTEPERDCEEIVLSSDEEEEVNNQPQRNVLLNRMLDQGVIPSGDDSYVSRTGRNFGHFGGGLINSSRLEISNVISLSSGDEDSSGEICRRTEKRLEKKYERGKGRADVDSDDDCVVISPSPEEEEVEKDEKNQDELNVPDAFGRVLVNVGHPEEDPDIFLAPHIAKIVKPHQIGGIRFLYDNVVESVERFDMSSGFGCILAHSMGLGKSIQTVSFCDVFLRVSTAKAKTILIIVPINTIQNWVNEFNMWLPTSGSKNSSASTTSTKPRKRRGNKNGKSFPNGDTNTVPQPTTAPANQTALPSEAQASSSVISNELNDSVSETVSLNLTFDSTLNLSEMLNNEDSSESRKQSGDDTSKEQPEVELEETPEAEVNSRGFEVFILNETVKTLQAREKVITQWSTNGGVLLIGYEMYRMLALKKLKKSTKKQPQQSFFSNYGMDVGETESLNRIHTCLVNPGPDLVICDEGHRIKNSGASISNALKAIKTRRRVVLTGYPLQNNLMEYWCMVDFIRPNYLGSKVEFSNMFERPISNGQCVDSTFEDRRLMRYRSHVLHSLLEGFVQRRSHAVLQTALPEKQEWVFLLKMTPVQYNLYKEFIKYLSENVEGQSAANPIKAFAVCCKIWNHPDALYNVVKKKQSILDDLDLDEVTTAADGSNSKPKGRGGNKKKDPQTGQDQIAYFDGSGFNFPRSHYGSYSTNTNSSGRSDQSLSLDWAMPIFQNYEPGVLENGVKFEILFEIIKESVACNDKLLVFSQSLLSLDLIETFLSQKFKWLKNEQYYRLDGSTTGLEREKLVNKFNAKPEVFVFLVSTRAGSLGINLTGANRVVVLDASWNPCHDCQAVCRIYRYGQTKPCQIYRFVSDCTLEKRIYDRQINKRGMSDRVVDEMNPNAQFKTKDVSSFLVLQHDHLDKLPFITWDMNPEKYSDPALKNLLHKVGHKLTQEPFEHESLLIDQKSQRLSATEKRLAYRQYLNEKRTASLQSSSGYSYSRPSYAAFYPKDAASTSSPSTLGSGVHSRVGGYGGSVTNYKQFQLTNEDRFEQHVTALRAKGICVQNIVLKKDAFLADPGGGPDMFIMAGEKVYVLRSEKGTYLRISNGKLIAVRNNTANSRIPGMSVPPNQELSKEQLHGLVYSFLKIPGHHTLDSYQTNSNSTSTSDPYPPTEQPLPPSPSFFSQSRNHLQVTNSRNNSGGDVMLWHDKDASQNDGLPKTGVEEPNSTYGGRESSRINPYTNSTLEKLSYLANQFPGYARAAEYGFPGMRSNSSPVSGMGLSSTPPNASSSHYRILSDGSPSRQSELEVIPIPKSSSSLRSNKSSSNDSDSFSSSRSYHRRRKTASHHLTGSEQTPQKDILDVNPYFYKDFTVTVKSNRNGTPSDAPIDLHYRESSPQSSSANKGRKVANSVPKSSSGWLGPSSVNNFRENAIADYDAMKSVVNQQQMNISSNVSSADPNSFENAFQPHGQDLICSNSNQYYDPSSSNTSNGNLMAGTTSNCNSNLGYEDLTSGSRSENIPVYFPFQGV